MTKMMKDGILFLKDLLFAFLILFFKYFHRFIFPGLALGAALGQTGVVTNAMINASAEVCLLFAIFLLHGLFLFICLKILFPSN